MVTYTPAEILRRAATRMRELANAATPGPWTSGDGYPENAAGDNFGEIWHTPGEGRGGEEYERDAATAAFIAALHPGVALLVADQWEAEAVTADGYVSSQLSKRTRLAVEAALTFLGEA